MGMAANNVNVPSYVAMLDKLDRQLNTVHKVYSLELWTGKSKVPQGKVEPRVTTAKWSYDMSKQKYSLNLTFNMKLAEMNTDAVSGGIYKIWSSITLNEPELNYDKVHMFGNEARLDFNLTAAKKTAKDRKKNSK